MHISGREGGEEGRDRENICSSDGYSMHTDWTYQRPLTTGNHSNFALALDVHVERITGHSENDEAHSFTFFRAGNPKEKLVLLVLNITPTRPWHFLNESH